MSQIVIPYSPREYQQEIHDLCDSNRFGVAVCHRRFGKSVLFANHLVREAVRTEKADWRGAFVGPTYTQAKQILWDHLKTFTRVIPKDHIEYNESELRIDFVHGPRIRLYGADRPDSLRGIYLDMGVFDEFDLMKMNVFTEVVRPALADRGGKAYFIGTFKFVDGPLGQLYDLAQTQPGWFRKLYRASDTGYVPEEELEDARAVMSVEEYDREFECKRTSSMRGSILGRQVDEADAEGRIGKVPHDPALTVTTAWDLGMRDSTAIWFVQQYGQEVRVIDFYQNEGEDLAHYIKMLGEKPYNYADHIAPHDIGVRELISGKTRYEAAMMLGINFRVLPRVSQKAQSEIEERISAGRMLLPRVWFDAEKCRQGLTHLRSWRREESPQTGALRAQPVHDVHSHAGDAFTYLAMGLRRVGKVVRPKLNTAWMT